MRAQHEQALAEFMAQQERERQQLEAKQAAAKEKERREQAAEQAELREAQQAEQEVLQHQVRALAADQACATFVPLCNLECALLNVVMMGAESPESPMPPLLLPLVRSLSPLTASHRIPREESGLAAEKKEYYYYVKRLVGKVPNRLTVMQDISINERGRDIC